MRFTRWLRSDRYLLICACNAQTAPPAPNSDGFHCNRSEDLGLFEQTEKWLPRGAFVMEAQRRMAEGMHLYTFVADQKLVHYGWLVPRQDRAWFPYVRQHYDFPAGTAVLFNAYTHPGARGKGLHVRSMRRRIADAAAAAGTKSIYTAIESHNLASRAVAAKIGFECVEVLYEIVRLGNARRGRMTAENYFSSVEGKS